MTSQSLWNKNFILLVCMNLLAQAAFNLITPLLSLYVLQFGASLATAGLVVGIFALTALLLGPLARLLIDRMNKKYLLMTCTFINGLATFGYMLAPNTAAMIFLRMLHGVSFTVAISTNMGWISDFIPQKRLGEGMGYYSIGQVIAMAAAPTAGIEISDRIGIDSTFLLAALLLIAATIGMSFMQSSPALPHPKFSFSSLHLSDIISFPLLPLSLIGGLFSMGNGLASSFLVLLAQERDIPNIGLYFTVNALCLLLTRPLAGKLYDKKGRTVFHPLPGSALCYPGSLVSWPCSRSGHDSRRSCHQSLWPGNSTAITAGRMSAPFRLCSAWSGRQYVLHRRKFRSGIWPARWRCSCLCLWLYCHVQLQCGPASKRHRCLLLLRTSEIVR